MSVNNLSAIDMLFFPVNYHRSSAQSNPIRQNPHSFEIIELQRPEPTHQPGRVPGRTEDLDAFIRQQTQNPHNSYREAQIALLVNPPSDPDEFFRRLDDIEAQASSQVHETGNTERPPAFDQPPTYDEAVPAPDYKAGFKRTVKNHAGLIIMGGVMFCIMAVVGTCGALIKGNQQHNTERL